VLLQLYGSQPQFFRVDFSQFRNRLFLQIVGLKCVKKARLIGGDRHIFKLN